MIRSNSFRIVKHCSRCNSIVLYAKKGCVPSDDKILCYECRQSKYNKIKKEKK